MTFSSTLPTKRVSKDSVVNENGSSLLDFCKQTGYMLLNDRTGTDKGIGEYTCVKRAGSSVVDYVLCRNCDLKYISDFEILPPAIFSDHSQVLFTMKFNRTPLVKYMTRQFNVDTKLVWEEGKV